MRTLLLSTVLAATTGLAAQTYARVVPSGAATKDPSYYDFYNFLGTTLTTLRQESHTQYLYDSADVGGAAVWKSLWLRRPRLYGSTQAATTFSSTVIMSNSPHKYSTPSTTFTRNHGTTTSGTPPQTVFSGTISLPQNRRGTNWPEPWFTVAVFKTVFAHVPVNGGSLVVEFINSNNSQTRTYYVEGFKSDLGARTQNGQVAGCQWTSEGIHRYNNSIGYRLPVIGGQWYISHGGMPSNEPNLKKSLNIIGLQGVGGTAFGQKLPIPIASLGFLDICKVRPGQLFNDLVITQPLTYTASTAGPGRGTLTSPTVNIPNDPNLGGAVFYQQAFCTDKPLNGYDQIYMGWPSKWTIGSNKGLPGNLVYKLFDNLSTTGSVRRGYGQTCQFK